MSDNATPLEEVKGLLLHTNGQCLPISVPKDSIDEIQQYLACDVFTTVPCHQDSVGGKHGLTIYADDEALLKHNTPVNIWSIWLCSTIGYSQPIVGSVLVFGPPDIDGYSTNVPDKIREMVPPTLRPSPDMSFMFWSKEGK